MNRGTPLKTLVQTGYRRLKKIRNNPAIAETPHWRPKIHFSPAKGWMNDPNGLIVENGIFHLFFQYIPDAATQSFYPFNPSKIVWGHTVSDNLLNWEIRANSRNSIALHASGKNVPFSGSAVLLPPEAEDESSSQMVLIYTECNLRLGFIPANQVQRIAISDGNSRHEAFIPYAENPVAQRPVRSVQFRDPKVLRYHPSDDEPYWLMVLAGGDHILFFRSDDLKQWTELSPLPVPMDTGRFVECPDLLQVPVIGTERTAWVLTYCSGSLPDLSLTESEYLVGNFDGNTFMPHPNTQGKKLDAGPDFYAAQSWYNYLSPDKEPVVAGWMNNWKYAEDLPTSPWRGQLSIPRRLSLLESEGNYTLCQQPVPEVEQSRFSPPLLSAEERIQAPGTRTVELQDAPEVLDIVLQIHVQQAARTGISLRAGAQHRVDIYWDSERSAIVLDRTQMGSAVLPESVMQAYAAPLQLTEGVLHLRIILDQSSVEVFGGAHGEAVISALIFPDAVNRNIELFTEGTDAALLQALEIFELQQTMYHE